MPSIPKRMKFLWKCFSKQQLSWLRELVRIHKPGWKKPGSQTPDREAIGKGETISLRERNPDYSKGHVLSFLLHCLHLQILDLQIQEKEHFEEKHQDTFPKGQIIEWVLKWRVDAVHTRHLLLIFSENLPLGKSLPAPCSFIGYSTTDGYLHHSPFCSYHHHMGPIRNMTKLSHHIFPHRNLNLEQNFKGPRYVGLDYLCGSEISPEFQSTLELTWLLSLVTPDCSISPWIFWAIEQPVSNPTFLYWQNKFLLLTSKEP